MSLSSPEKRILTRLFSAQRRLRYVRALAQALRWFSLGSLSASLALLLLWNWDRLPGPWQWLATAGRPAELLWLPPLFALGGFATRWLITPAVRETAFAVDRLRDGQERLLTAVDWILSEKPRTPVSERVLARAAAELDDESRLRQDLRRLEGVPRRLYGHLLSCLIPLTLLCMLPPHVGLPDSAAVWLGTGQVDRLTEELLEELEQSRGLEKPEEKLRELLHKLEQNQSGQLQAEQLERTQRELQRTADQLERMARSQESARQLLETLAQRSRQGQALSEQDRKALEELKQSMQEKGQKEALEQAEQAWGDGQAEQAAEALEELQRESGQAARELQELAREGQESGAPPPGGQEFQEGQGDQHSPGKPSEGQQGQGQPSVGQPGGPSPGQDGTPIPGDFGQGSTEKDEGGTNAAGNQSGRQSARTSDKEEEFKNLHPPVRVETETSQTRVSGARGEDGPRYRTEKEGRGAVTSPAEAESGGGLLRYQQNAENALLREEIPADYRDEVRQYFEALDR